MLSVQLSATSHYRASPAWLHVPFLARELCVPACLDVPALPRACHSLNILHSVDHGTKPNPDDDGRLRRARRPERVGFHVRRDRLRTSLSGGERRAGPVDPYELPAVAAGGLRFDVEVDGDSH